MGRFPEEAVAMLAKIAAATEAHRPLMQLQEMRELCRQPASGTITDMVAAVVEHALLTVPCAAVIVPTRTGTTPRMISRHNPPVWIAAASADAGVCQGLHFSYGVVPVELAEEPEAWRGFAADWVRQQRLAGALAMLVAGPSARHPDANHRLEFIRLDQ
jgi:pyruvate kinase